MFGKIRTIKYMGSCFDIEGAGLKLRVAQTGPELNNSLHIQQIDGPTVLLARLLLCSCCSWFAQRQLFLLCYVCRVNILYTEVWYDLSWAPNASQVAKIALH